MIVAAVRRLTILALVVGVATVTVGALVGLATGGSARRDGALGLYAVGALSTLVGIGVAGRNSLFYARPGATSTHRDQASAEARELAGLLIVLGVLLVVAAIALDPAADLV